MRVRPTSVLIVLALAGPAVPSLPAQVWSAQAQAPSRSRVRPEVRVDYITARTRAVHLGLGVSAPVGTYARLGVVAGAGPEWISDAATVSTRIDGYGRFMLDPARQARVGVSLGAGIGVRRFDDETRTVALVFVDAEGGRRTGWVPFAQAGLGDGLRLTAGLRRAAFASR